MKPRVFKATYTWGVIYETITPSGLVIRRTSFYVEWRHAMNRALKSPKQQEERVEQPSSPIKLDDSKIIHFPK